MQLVSVTYCRCAALMSSVKKCHKHSINMELQIKEEPLSFIDTDNMDGVVNVKSEPEDSSSFEEIVVTECEKKVDIVHHSYVEMHIKNEDTAVTETDATCSEVHTSASVTDKTVQNKQQLYMESYTKSLEYHKRTTKENEPFTCLFCSSKFTLRNTLHLQKHFNFRPYLCGYCDMKFFTSHELNAHMKSTHKKRYGRYCRQPSRQEYRTRKSSKLKYVCKVCEAVCPSFNSYKLHMDMHGKEGSLKTLRDKLVITNLFVDL